jgi:hypothetical protein
MMLLIDGLSSVQGGFNGSRQRSRNDARLKRAHVDLPLDLLADGGEDVGSAAPLFAM